MRFFALSEARYYVTTHAPEFRRKLRIVKFRHCRLNDSGTDWEYRDAWTVVMA